MPISKALRFEVLRRDGFACTYCGAKAPEVALHLDHVLPVALGGQDTPENLRTACVECNAGKGSTPPDADLVAQVADDAERWARAVAVAAEEMAAEDRSAQWFVDLWLSVDPYDGAHLPLDAKQRVSRLQSRGLPREVIEEMFWVAMAARHVLPRNRYAYFNGACNRRLEQIHARAAEIVTTESAEQ